MSVNIHFDTIAQSYNAQRAHPREVSEQIGRAIAAIVGQNALVLELGVGTGRIAHPVATHCRVVGVDLARDMLRVAAEDRRLKTEDQKDSALPSSVFGLPSLSLLQGDIAQLPFHDNAFDAVLAVHVLHLVPDWRGVLAEAARVLRPGGVFVQGRDWRDPASVAERLRAKLRETVMALVPGARPPGAGAAIAQALAKLGGAPEGEIVAAEWTDSASSASILVGMAARADAETWALDDATLEAAVARVRAYAEETYHDLDTLHPVERRFVLNPVRF